MLIRYFQYSIYVGSLGEYMSIIRYLDPWNREPSYDPQHQPGPVSTRTVQGHHTVDDVNPASPIIRNIP